MKLLQILQIAQMGLGIFTEMKSKPSTEKKPTKAQLREYILASSLATEAMGHLTVKDRKKWNKDIDKAVDLVLSFDANSEWK